MILWDKTKKKYGITKETAKNKDSVIIQCSKCNKITQQNYKGYKLLRKKNPIYVCRACVNKSDKYKTKQSDNMKRVWQDQSYRANKKVPKNKQPHSPATKKKISEKSKKLWQDPEFGQKITESLRKLWLDPEFKQKMATINASQIEKLRSISNHLWKSPEHRSKYYKAIRKPGFIEKQIKSHKTTEYLEKQAIRLANTPKVSNIQSMLYSILDDLNITYFREYNDKPDDPQCRIGPWSFDCVIPRPNSKTLLIECQGDYWHNNTKTKLRDIRKQEYVKNYLASEYELKYLWEHEFYQHNKIINTIEYWLNISNTKLISFSFDDVAIHKSKSNEYTPLLAKYHYLATAGRGGIAYGAYLENKLIAICIFSPLVRQNIQIANYNKSCVRELSRFCIHPKYQKKNFGSWLISKCINKLPKKYKCIIAYTDTTFNHTGSLYLACNFKLDKTIPPSYWYVSQDKWVMHKKTLYNRAIKMGMKESEFAEKFGYTKVHGSQKKRFILHL